MEIIPGEGVALAKVGESRQLVESRLGPPPDPGHPDKAVYNTSPRLVLTYTADDTVELVELALSGDGDEEVFFDGIQLTYRFIDDVVADLAAKGHQAEPIDIGYRFKPGFAIFSMGSRSATELDPQASEEDPRRICEGVSVASYAYLAGPTEDEIVEYIRRKEAARGVEMSAADIRKMMGFDPS
jgi:hypothetical protein